jgi:hypothetical protein
MTRTLTMTWTRWTTVLAVTTALALGAAACSDSDGESATDAPQPTEEGPDEQRDTASSTSAPEGVTLDASQQTITSALRVDLTRDFATLPLYEGSAGGETVWYVITDVSDADMAAELGVNHSPKLANAGTNCPACVQVVTTDDPVLGRAPVEFQGAPDFSPVRTLVPSPAPFPAESFTPGGIAGARYSPFVALPTDAVDDTPIVFNAPIIATGDGPFDVTTHADTHDRTLGIDTEEMTADLLFVRGFANGRSIFYLSFDSSDAFTATVERSTFTPALTDLGFANGGGDADSARASIFTFVNAKAGLEEEAPERGASQGPGRAQGLTHALSLEIVGLDAAVDNPEVLEALRTGADVSNIFDVFPTNDSAADRAEYSPAWDLQVGVYSDAAVAAGSNGLQTDANMVRGLAEQGIVTAPGGLPLGSANIVINCPALGFFDEAPLGPRVPMLGA